MRHEGALTLTSAAPSPSVSIVAEKPTLASFRSISRVRYLKVFVFAVSVTVFLTLQAKVLLDASS